MKSQSKISVLIIIENALEPLELSQSYAMAMCGYPFRPSGTGNNRYPLRILIINQLIFPSKNDYLQHSVVTLSVNCKQLDK